MVKEEIIYELISKELTSDISEKERELLKNRLELNPEFKSNYSIIKKYWKSYFPKIKSNRSIEKAEQKAGLSYRSKKTNKLDLFYKIAASVIIVFSLAYLGYHRFQKRPVISLNQYITGPGEVKNIVLSDGTNVWLNSFSALIASEPFTKENREVTIFGEGYFEVKHNPDKPFIVKTSTLRTKVLGTHFNISAYPNDNVQEISLYEGSIELSGMKSSKKNLRVNPGEKVFYSNTKYEFNVIATDLGKPAQWRDGTLRFYDEDFSTIAKMLERKFQTRIVFTDDNVSNLHFTANFEGESLTKILDLLKEAHEFDYKKFNNNFIIQSKKT